MHSITFKPEDSDFLTRMNLANHRVALATLPWVALVLLVRALLEVFLGFEGIFSAETVTPFTTASMFVIAIILGGVLEDYKEAERIPAEMAGALDSLSEKLQFMELATSRAAARQERLREEGGGAVGGEEPVVVASSAEEHGELLAYITALIEYFAGMRGDQDILGVTSMFSRYFALKVNESSEWTHTEVRARVRARTGRARILPQPSPRTRTPTPPLLNLTRPLFFPTSAAELGGV